MADPHASTPRSELTRRRIRAAWLFLAPMLVVLALVAGWPLVRTVWFSLTDANLGEARAPRFVGVANYLHYGPRREDWDPRLRGYFVFYEPTHAALVYRPQSGTFYDLDSERPVEDYDPAAVRPYEQDGVLIVPPPPGSEADEEAPDAGAAGGSGREAPAGPAPPPVAQPPVPPPDPAVQSGRDQPGADRSDLGRDTANQPQPGAAPPEADQPEPMPPDEAEAGAGPALAYLPYAGEIDTARAFQWQGVLADAAWWQSVWNTLVFAFGSVAAELVLGMVIALILNAHLPGRGLLRAAVLIPWAIPTIVSARLWGWMLNDQFGVVNDVLLWLGVISERLAWTADPALALPAVIAVDVWKTTPFMALLLLAALQLLPDELYEAGRVDGVHPVVMFFSVTLPLIWPAMMVAVIFRLLDALRVFDLIYVLTPGSLDTMSMSVYAREQLIQFQDVGYGSAAATLLFAVVAVLTAVTIVAGRVRFGEER